MVCLSNNMSEPIATNKKAYHNYHLMDKWECGIELVGPEVKSLRESGASFTDSYARIDKEQMYLYNVHITPYKQASYNNLEAVRTRRLLLNRKEIERIKGRLASSGLTLIPTKMYFNKRGFVKVEIALGQGKKAYDKRESIKEREAKREIDRGVKIRR